MEKQKISIAVIAQDEADRIGRLLKSCAFADEIVVVDSGSSDGTPAICQNAGAKVIFNPWAGYVAQKQFALEATAHDWILCLDADEEVPEALAAEIIRAVQSAPPDTGGFSMPRLSRYLGRWIRHGGWYPDRKVRLVRRGRGAWQGVNPHDKLVVEGPVTELTQPFLHYVYRGISDQVVTMNNFSEIYARQERPAGGWFVAAGLFHAVGKFLECYIWKLGFLDGVPGLVIAVNSAGYVFLKHAKRWERNLSGT
ncbi:MAG: glycosyltransferase family 2 protein [Deltaproteobacteria bacterium]